MRALRLFTLIAFAAAAWGEEGVTADCSSIESNPERLICYDERARADRRQHAPAPAAAQPPSVAAGQVKTPEPNAAAEPAVVPEPPLENFGTLKVVAQPTHVATRIESIKRAPLGQYVMWLSNGQVWSENEPGTRPIEAGQDVVITKRRLHYQMRLQSGRKVSVRRIDNR